MHLSRELNNLPPDAEKIVLHFTNKVLMIDHTTIDNLMPWVIQSGGENGGKVEMDGLDRLRKMADSDHATRLLIDTEYEQVTAAG